MRPPMIKLFEKLKLPVPSKKDIIFVSTILVLMLVCWKQYNVISDKEDIIESKNVEISVQKKTISELDKSYKESSEKIKNMNNKLNLTEEKYQDQLNKLMSAAGNCKSTLNPSEIEVQAQKDFQEIIDDLAYSTKKGR